MFIHSSVAAVLLAAQAMAQTDPIYDCNIAKDLCAKDVAAGKTASSVCEAGFTACQACVTKEHSCRVGANDNYQAQTKCTVAAQICYEMALSPGSTNGYYGCKQAFDSCSFAPQANHSFCAAQRGACVSCQEKEDKCRNAPGANQSLCSSGVGGCFVKAMTL